MSLQRVQLSLFESVVAFDTDCLLERNELCTDCKSSTCNRVMLLSYSSHYIYFRSINLVHIRFGKIKKVGPKTKVT